MAYLHSIYCKVKKRIHGETSHAISIKRCKCMSGWIDGWKGVAYSLRHWFSLLKHPFLLFFETWLPPFFFSLSLSLSFSFFLGHASLACHLFSFLGNHNLTLFYFRDVLRESSPRHGPFIDGKWMDDGAQFLV